MVDLYHIVEKAVTGPYRGRVLTYGPNASKMLLYFFDTVGQMIKEQ